MSDAPPNIAIRQDHSLTMLVQHELARMVLAGEKLDELALFDRGPVRETLRALTEKGPGPPREEPRREGLRVSTRSERHGIYDPESARMMTNALDGVRGKNFIGVSGAATTTGVTA